MINKLLFTEFQKVNKLHIWLFLLYSIPVVLIAGVFITNGTVESGPDWGTFLMQVNTMILLFLPIVITIVCSHLAGVEHQSRMWKVWYALPLRKGELFIAKVIGITILLILSAGVYLLNILVIGNFFEIPHPVSKVILLKQIFYPYLAFLPIVIFQLTISTFIQNQAFPIAIGCFTAIFSYTFSIFPSSIGKFLFWAYPSSASLLQPNISDGEFQGMAISGQAHWYFIASLILSVFMIIVSFYIVERQHLK